MTEFLISDDGIVVGPSSLTTDGVQRYHPVDAVAHAEEGTLIPILKSLGIKYFTVSVNGDAPIVTYPITVVQDASEARAMRLTQVCSVEHEQLLSIHSNNNNLCATSLSATSLTLYARRGLPIYPRCYSDFSTAENIAMEIHEVFGFREWDFIQGCTGQYFVRFLTSAKSAGKR